MNESSRLYRFQQSSRLTIISIIFLVCLTNAFPVSGQRRQQRSEQDRFALSMQRKARTDSTYRALSEGVLDFNKTSYRSRAGGLDIPVYIFQPLEKRSDGGHAALIWVHENLHGDLHSYYFPFIKEAVERGYVVVAPEYRGSTGYGKEFYDAIDYGGYEVDDCLCAVDYINRRLPHVDKERIGVIGWSHGGLITLLAVMREENTLKAAAAIVPVTNLIFRLGFKGLGYQQRFVDQERVGGRPHEKRDIFIDRSPLYHVDNLKIPLLVHLADNDTDVNFEEAEQLAWALMDKKRGLAEVKIYHDPPGGHNFNRIVDRSTFRRNDSPEQRDSWNRIWTFLEWNLRPYEGK